MKYAFTAILAASVAAVVRAQVTYVNGTFQCAIANGTYCAGDSLTTNIIIRCTNGVGAPGNCDDNLAGQAPLGVNPSLCYQTSTTTGDAACSKNGTVYPDSGSSFPLPSNNSATSSSAAGTAPVSYQSTATVTYNMTTRTHTAIVGCTASGTPFGSSANATSPAGQASGSITAGPGSPSSTSAPSAYTGAAANLNIEAITAFAGFGVLAVAAALL